LRNNSSNNKKIEILGLPVIPNNNKCVYKYGLDIMRENNIPDTLKEAIISYFSGDLNQQQADELVNWLSQSATNANYIKEVREIWHASAILDEGKFNSELGLKRTRMKIRERNFRQVKHRVIAIRVSLLFKIAAAVFIIILLGIGTTVIHKKQKPIMLSDNYFEAEAPKGSKSLITLPEGTKVWLNAGTTLRYKNSFGMSNRDVFLDGEAFFSVTKNNEIPFKVNTSELAITALGTSFNVKSYGDENQIETTLEEGSLRIETLKSNKYSKRVGTIYLKQNQNLIYQKQSKTVTVSQHKNQENSKVIPLSGVSKNIPVKVTTVTDTRLYTSWKDKQWVFKNEKLSNLAPKLERRYDINIIFKDSSLLSYAFSGTLKDESIEQVLAAIRFTAPIRFEVNYKVVTLYIDNQLEERYFNLLKP